MDSFLLTFHLTCIQLNANTYACNIAIQNSNTTIAKINKKDNNPIIYLNLNNLPTRISLHGLRKIYPFRMYFPIH